MDRAAFFPPEVVMVTATPEMWESPVLEAEEQLISQAIRKRQREFRAGRHCAHTALQKLGLPRQAVLRDANRAPLWPEGYLGSISHCQELCIAACAKQHPIISLGLDVEPLKPLKPGLEKYIHTTAETAYLESFSPRLPERLVFSAKESLYKCFYPLLETFFGFHAVEIAIDDQNHQFGFKPTGNPKIHFPENLEFYGHYMVTATHLVTGCYLMPAYQ